MATVLDVARYILERSDEMTVMKLQKLAYYSQAWNLVWDEASLFDEEIEAWANGPVIRDLYDAHAGHFKIDNASFNRGNSEQLTASEKETIDGVLEFYGDKTAQWLSDLTHMEDPWLKAREKAGVADGERSNEVITLDSMHEYYSGL